MADSRIPVSAEARERVLAAAVAVLRADFLPDAGLYSFVPLRID